MFRKFVAAALTAVAEILETMADAIAAPSPPPATDSPRLRVVASRSILTIRAQNDARTAGMGTDAS